MPFIVLAVSLALSFLSSGVSRSDLRAHGLVESTALLVNIRRIAGSGPLLAGVVAGSGVNALFCILDILVPTAGGGMVKATMSGDGVLQSITIDPQALDPEDVELLQDMIVAAVNEASNNASDVANQRMGAITGGLNIPGLF